MGAEFPHTPGQDADRIPPLRTVSAVQGEDVALVRSLEGDWRSGRQYIELRKGTGKIVVPFTAGEVNLVMQPGASGNAAVTVLLDGKPVAEARGADVGPDGVARFDRSGMLRLVAGASGRRQVLTVVASDPGLRAYVFTFGP